MEEVERKIRARRRRNNFNNPSVDRALAEGRGSGPLSKLSLNGRNGPRK